MTRYHAYLEEDADGTCLAHVPDLAGCAVAGASRVEALASLPAAIRGYLDWCAAHGDPLPEDGDIDIVLAEVAPGCRPWRQGGANALFSVDRAPLGDAELRTYLRRMSFSRADLLATVRPSAVNRLDQPCPAGGRTVRQLLEHLIATESWYISRLGRRIDPGGGDVLERLVEARARAVEVIISLSPRQRDLVYIPTECPSENPEEGWTLRKVLRRFLEHERSHLRDIELAGTLPAAASTAAEDERSPLR